MPLSHTSIKIAHGDTHTATIAWYEKALAPLGYKKAMVFMDGAIVGYSDANDKTDWWVSAAKEGESPVASHHAFSAENKAAVDAFYKAGLEAGGKDNGAPGPRPMYGPTYYAAFVLDPAGNNIEAVTYSAE
ncbi:Glyoxalase/Bleomycin resistance protein/Dihydroxybiphenyl dioxygenase [Apodospora peruviana]|uniref:Glyoxalase/Bleomycin resistance protein/Dihydroxybiphenyl dioxygenase n=1 Tax=Apodospora peruviana TaxID=516989 RepID=A0AAE0IU67_9PEZI|nr:Glyoxalase/Bleomycin resistance protein/Dihydroxybiphenyl dioxygenase [Apodospora peruviana]